MSSNEPAFPITGKYEGITKREYFAAKAMSSMLSNQSMYDDNLTSNDIAILSIDAFLIADAMIRTSKQVQS